MNKREEIQTVLQRIEQIQKELSELYQQIEQWKEREKTSPANYFETKHEYDLGDFEEVTRQTLDPFESPQKKAQEPMVEKSASTPFMTDQQSPLRTRKALTDYISVIDHFRFKRELFGDDSQEMARVLDEIARLNTEEDLKNYLVVVLHWDDRRDEVQNFFDRLRPYFL